MEFQDYKKKYDELMIYKGMEEDVLDQDKSELFSKNFRANELNNICNSLKNEINRLNYRYQQYSEIKFNSINNRLQFLLGFLSLIGYIITFFVVGGGAIGLICVLLAIAASTLVSGIVFVTYNFISFSKPKWITRFWKKYETFKELETSIKEKEKELEKNLQLYGLLTKEIECINQRIYESKNYIREIESQINNLLVSYSTRLFDVPIEKFDDTDTKAHTKIRRPQSQN